MNEADWRQPSRWLNAVMGDEVPDPRTALRGKDAAGLLDAFAACADWCVMAIDPEVAAMGVRMREAVDAVLRGEKDIEGRAVPIGRLLGVQPPAGATATRIIADERRNALLLAARASVDQWVALPPRKAAAQMIKAFDQYRAGGWQADQERDDAPGGNPVTANWWRLLRSGHSKPMPKIDRLSDILAG